MLIFVYKTGWFTVRLFALITHQTIILALFFSFVFVSLCTHIRALFRQIGKLHLCKSLLRLSLYPRQKDALKSRIKHWLVKEASVQFRVVKLAADWVDSCHVIERKQFSTALSFLYSKLRRSWFPSLSRYIFI